MIGHKRFYKTPDKERDKVLSVASEAVQEYSMDRDNLNNIRAKVMFLADVLPSSELTEEGNYGLFLTLRDIADDLETVIGGLS